MNSYRVTLRAFGTTGVLVAASLAMLATVSALVAFDGWPSGSGSNGVDSVSVSGAGGTSALVVHGTRGGRPGAARATPAPAGFVKTVGPGASGAGNGFATGLVKTVGPAGPSLGPLGFSQGPTPWVGASPPGEGGPQPQQPNLPGHNLTDRIGNAACGAASSVCGAAQGTIGLAPQPSAIPIGSPPGEPSVPAPQVQVPVQAPVQAPAQAPVSLPGG